MIYLYGSMTHVGSALPTPEEGKQEFNFEAVASHVAASVSAAEVVTFQDNTQGANSFRATRADPNNQQSPLVVNPTTDLIQNSFALDIVDLTSILQEYPDMGQQGSRAIAAAILFPRYFNVEAGRTGMQFTPPERSLFTLVRQQRDGSTVIQMAGAISDESDQIARHPTATLCTLVFPSGHTEDFDPVRGFLTLLEKSPEDALQQVMKNVSGNDRTYAPLQMRRQFAEQTGGHLIEHVYIGRFDDQGWQQMTRRDRQPGPGFQWSSTPLQQ